VVGEVEASGWAQDWHALDDHLAEPNLCRFATTDPGGDPHVVPAWYHWDGERFWIGAQAGDHKVRNVRRSGRAAVEVDGDIRRKRGILVRGTAWVVEGAEGRSAYIRISQAQLRRYLPDRPPIEMANRMADKGVPVVIVLAPESIVSWGR